METSHSNTQQFNWLPQPTHVNGQVLACTTNTRQWLVLVPKTNTCQWSSSGLHNWHMSMINYFHNQHMSMVKYWLTQPAHANGEAWFNQLPQHVNGKARCY